MAVREFNGTSDAITLGGDGAALSGWGLMLVVRPLTTSGLRAFISPNASASDIGTLWTNSSSTQLAIGWSSGDANANITFNTTDWFLWGTSKAAGAVPRFHSRNLTTGAAAQHVAGTDAGGGTTDNAGAWVNTKIATFSDGTNFGNFRLAVAAVYDIAYTDGNFDTITTAKTTQSMYALGPDRLWDFNQASTGTAVVNLLTGSNDQTAISGTTVVNGADPPGWTFGLGVAPAYVPHSMPKAV